MKSPDRLLHVDLLCKASLTAYALAILIGSVHLAWHYAVDGYAAIALADALWLFSG